MRPIPAARSAKGAIPDAGAMRRARAAAPPWALASFVILVAMQTGAAGFFGSGNPRQSVVKVYSTIQKFDPAMPWQSEAPISGTGSGFIVEKRRILTNAHVVSDARFIEIQKDGDPRRYQAEVQFIGHDCDLAVLKVSDPEFFKGTKPLPVGQVLPDLNDEVNVLGYPMGGDRLSITRGVVSRIDYGIYTHSGIDMHLVVQVDAAINPGNSGGPVMYRGKVIGMAFQVLSHGQNIGYTIPIPVLKHFLADIDDGRYDGYPELGVAHSDLRNPALRKDLKLPEDRSGVVVYYVDPFGSAWENLKPRDVLLGIDGHAIANDGTVQLGETQVEYTELLERKQCGESLVFDIWRDGKELRVPVVLNRPEDPFTFRSVYDQQPQYLIVGGLVFSPLTSDYLRRLGPDLEHNQHLLYYSQYAKIEGLYKDRDEFVVLINRLAHRINTYDGPFMHAVVSEVNGRRIRDLRGMKEALRSPTNGFHVIRFEGRDDLLVMEAADVARANAEILPAYGVPSAEHFEVTP